jgi:hypothetical protein
MCLKMSHWPPKAISLYPISFLFHCSIVCVCVFLASSYDWVAVMHEIPISSAQKMTSFHTLELSSTIPLVPLKKGLFSHEKVPTGL